jgi:hypothetical protein
MATTVAVGFQWWRQLQQASAVQLKQGHARAHQLGLTGGIVPVEPLAKPPREFRSVGCRRPVEFLNGRGQALSAKRAAAE